MEKIKDKPSHAHQGEEGKVCSELLTAMVYNYVSVQKVVPVVNIYINGYYVRFIGMTAKLRYSYSLPPSSPSLSHIKIYSYVKALLGRSLVGVHHSAFPQFTSFPPYNPNKPYNNQGFNLLDAVERVQAIEALVQLRHNIICTCPGI